MAASQDLIVVGKILKPFGVRGDMRVLSLTDVPGRLEALAGREVTLALASGRSRTVRIAGVREDGGGYLIRIEGCASPEEAAAFRGAMIQVPRGQSPVLPAGQYYVCDLIGLEVRDVHGRSLGRLEEVVETADAHLFVVRGEGREVLIPAAKHLIVSVDVAAGVMTVRGIDALVEQTAHVAV